MKKAKKGFTIVELVVVIAVIAILAAVLIPTFISIVNRAKVSNDNQLVRNLNTALITEEADGNKAENMSQAIEIAEDYGYKLENLQAKADGYVLLWNQTTNRFYVESAEGTITSNPEVTDFPQENYTYWEISKTLGTKHSTYLTEGSGNIAATNLGVDVSGISSAVNVTYTGNSNKVIIATNGGDLSVTAGTGHVAHYGFVKNLTVTAVNGADCYREHGYVGTLATFGTGKFVAEKGSQFHQTEEQIKTAVNPESNTFVDLGATYGVHKRDENGICVICNDGGTPSVKNGLVDGYYYKDDVLYTGTETDNGTTYTFENGRLVIDTFSKQYINTSPANNTVEERVYNYTISSNAYLTKEIIIRGNNSSYDSPATINITDNSGKNYIVQSVNAKKPFGGLLNKDNWTIEDINTYLMNANGKSLISGGYKLSDSNILTSYDGESEDPDNYDIFVPNLCEDSALVKSYLSLTNCSGIQDYYDKYCNNTLIISFIDYLKLVYGKGYVLNNNDGTIEYKKTFGSDYQSNTFNGFYISVTADSSTGLPQIQLKTGGNNCVTAPTLLKDGKLAFCDYVIDADDETQIKNGNLLSQLKFFTNLQWYVSVSDNVVSLHEGSVSGTEICRFEIDNDNNVIKSYIKGTLTDVNGVPFSIPSSGTVTLVDGKISLTGAFSVEGVSVPVSALSGLVGLKRSSTLMFDAELIELVVKASYLGTLSVSSSDNEYALDNIPASIFAKMGSMWTTKIETVYSDSALSILVTNIFNGVDYAGTSYEIIMGVS